MNLPASQLNEQMVAHIHCTRSGYGAAPLKEKKISTE